MESMFARVKFDQLNEGLTNLVLLLLTFALNIIILTTWVAPVTDANPHPLFNIPWYANDNFPMKFFAIFII